MWEAGISPRMKHGPWGGQISQEGASGHTGGQGESRGSWQGEGRQPCRERWGEERWGSRMAPQRIRPASRPVRGKEAQVAPTPGRRIQAPGEAAAEAGVVAEVKGTKLEGADPHGHR